MARPTQEHLQFNLLNDPGIIVKDFFWELVMIIFFSFFNVMASDGLYSSIYINNSQSL